MRIRVISLAQCDATPATIALVQAVADEMAILIDLEHVVVSNKQEARQYRHIGSPTVQIDGVDIEPAARNIGRFGLG
jgi:hypothetical protein